MENSSNPRPTVDTILAVMANDLKNLIKSVEKIERGLESKVDLTSFHELKESFEDHKKDTSEKLSTHSTRLATGAGILIALSWAISLLK